MFSGYVRLYALDIFLVWLAKLMVLQFGGILLYRRVGPGPAARSARAWSAGPSPTCGGAA